MILVLLAILLIVFVGTAMHSIYLEYFAKPPGLWFTDGYREVKYIGVIGDKVMYSTRNGLVLTMDKYEFFTEWRKV